jgi:4,5:9,10-diseco-3-hydroxy-5,9,17-trioxoandrosta-1(10),2-diene-4-oate hydrolase
MLKTLNAKYADVGGFNLRYVVKGAGPSVLLIHGLSGYLETWIYNIGALSRHFTVYALDLPGHGLSEGPVANYTLDCCTHRIAVGFMAALRIERASLVGHSLGGLVCLSVAIHFPQKVDKLVMVDSAGLSKEAPLIYRLATLPVLGDILLKPTIKPLIKAGMEKGFYNPDIITDEMVNLSYKYWRAPKFKRALANLLRHNASIDGLHPEVVVTDKLHLVKAPTLLIHGVHDQVIPVEYARLACKLIPNVKCEVIDGCGHCPHIEKAAQFNDLVVAFLRASESAKKEPSENKRQYDQCKTAEIQIGTEYEA